LYIYISDIKGYTDKIVVTYIAQQTYIDTNFHVAFHGFHIVKIPITNKPIVFQRANNYYENVPYEKCTPFNKMIEINGTGYLFMDSIPANVQYGYNLMYIVYERVQDKATFNAPNRPFSLHPPPPKGKITPISGFSGTICNFPYFAKNWNIPTTGIPIEYRGEFNEYDDTVVFPCASFCHKKGYLVLTILKQ